jgi:predicted metal-dependent hydrolase
VVPSRRRRRTVQAQLVEGVLELRVPAAMPERERQLWAERMRGRIERQLRRAKPSNAALETLARLLNRRYFGGRLRWHSVSYAEQEKRWGSCTFTAGVIRISERAAKLPRWVLSYIVMHELAHLVRDDHGPHFWDIVGRYPLTERARGYLMAIDHDAAELM